MIPPIKAHIADIIVNTRLAENALALSRTNNVDPVTNTHSRIPKPFMLKGKAANTDPV